MYCLSLKEVIQWANKYNIVSKYYVKQYDKHANKGDKKVDTTFMVLLSLIYNAYGTI